MKENEINNPINSLSNEIDVAEKEASRHSIKDDRWHILNRTGMYLGSVVQSNRIEYLIQDGKFEQYETTYVPALVKMINEIIDNSTDALENAKAGKIDVVLDVDANTISVKDNGTGIPIINIQNLDGSDILTPKACWSLAKAGSNFNDDADDESTKGTNGVGAFCSNVMSTEFVGITSDGSNRYEGKWTDNCSVYNESIKSSNRKGTSVVFKPDLKRLGIEKFDDSTSLVIRQRLINLSLVHQNIKFTFNNEDISMTRKEFFKILGNTGEVYHSDNYSIAIMPSTNDDFETFSIVNGLNIKNGTHIDYILKYTQSAIKDKLPKKFSNIKPGDIKNKLKIVFIANKFPKIVWDGQTKELINNSDKSIRTYLGDDWKSLLIKVSKNKEIINPITFLFAAKLSAGMAILADEADKENKKKNVEKLRHAVKEKKYLITTEGDSATKGIIGGLDRVDKGYLPIGGVPPNPIQTPLSKLVKNPEYQDLMIALGLKFSGNNVVSDMEYEYVVIATDADVDGSHIKGLMFGFFYRFIPSIFNEKKILILNTPIKVAKDKKENMIAAFLNNKEYDDFIESGEKYDVIEYKKGLGSMNPLEYEQFFKLRPFKECLTEIDFSHESFDLMDSWLNKDTDFRKLKIEERVSLFDLDKI